MRKIHLHKNGANFESLLGQKPFAAAVIHAVHEDTMFFDADTEEPLGAYLILPEETVKGMRTVAVTTKVTATARAYRGLPTKSSVFGMVCRTPIRQDYCRFTQNSLKEPENHELVRAFARKTSSIYEQLFPAQYLQAMQAVKEVEPCWLMPGTPFATCNFNFNHAIKFHRDTGNISNAFSNVLILRENMVGGQLLFPEYGLMLAQTDRAFSIFNGNQLLHGVLPIRTKKPGGYRASIVYYTLAGSRNCLCQAEELRRIRSSRLEKEERRLLGIDPRDLSARVGKGKV